MDYRCSSGESCRIGCFNNALDYLGQETINVNLKFGRASQKSESRLRK